MLKDTKDDDKKEMLRKLIQNADNPKKEDKERVKPISINILLVPFDFTPGSNDSLQ
jgi:hypothetical protein